MNPVSPQLATARYLGALPWVVVPLLVVIGIVFWKPFWGWWWVIAALVVFTIWLIWLIPAQVKRIGWLETEDELLIQKGKLWHSLTVIPYGRIQFVDVGSGPIVRRLGMKSVSLHTASASSDSEVPGLPADVADALRERLAQRARERMSGL